MTLTTAAASLAVLLSILALAGYALSAGRLLERLATLAATVKELRDELRSMETLRAADQRHDAATTDLLRRVGVLEAECAARRDEISALQRQQERLAALAGDAPAHPQR